MERFKGEIAIRRALGDAVESVVFDHPTSGPAETISEMMRRAEGSGSVFIEDCDSWFTHTGNVFADVVCTANLQTLPTVRNVAGKSFVALNEHGIVDYTPDQWFTLHYLYPDGNFPIRFHNDVSGAIVDELERQLAERFIVAHPRDMDMHDGEFEEFHLNTYLNFLCYSYWEWEAMVEKRGLATVPFETHRNWPRDLRQRHAFLFARHRMSRRVMERSRLFPARLVRQIYD